MNMEILSLGKLIVEELGLDNSVDTLSRWIAHYIAQQMIELKSLNGQEKVIAEKKCFDTILKLWEHRACYEPSKYPFKNFESIFITLKRLNPDEQHFFFSNRNNHQHLQATSEDQVTINNLMDMATNIDKIARIWIEYILEQAAIYAKDEKTIEWLNASKEFEDLDTSVIMKLLENDTKEDETTNKARIQTRIEQLERFRDLNEELIRMYSEELRK